MSDITCLTLHLFKYSKSLFTYFMQRMSETNILVPRCLVHCFLHEALHRGIQSIGLFKALYTSPPGRPVPLHFTLWQTCSFTLHPPPPRRPVLLHFTPWQTCSFQHQLDFSGKLPASLREDYSFTYSPQSLAGYLFVQLNDLKQRCLNF